MNYKLITLVLLFCISCIRNNDNEVQLRLLILKDRIIWNDRIVKQLRETYPSNSKLKKLVNNTININEKIFKPLSEGIFEFFDYQKTQKYEIVLREHALKRLNTRRYSQEDSTTIRQIFERLAYHKKKNDKMSRLNWAIDYIHLQNFYLKDHRIDVYKGGTYGGGQFEYYDNFTFSDSDSVQVGKEKKVVIIPEYFNKHYEYVQYDSIRFLIDDIEKKVSYTFENFEGLGILQFIPIELGNYKIKGNYFIATKDKSEKRIESLIHFEFKGEK